MDLWRISNHQTLGGDGGRRYSARWHTAGSPIVYLAASPPGALLEILVHLELAETELPPSYTLLRISGPSRLRAPVLTLPDGATWKTDFAITQQIGDKWLAARRSALAQVPSAILPHTYNYLLNPRHRDAARIRITETITAPFDPRLLR